MSEKSKEKTKTEYELCWHDPIVANTIKEALEQVKSYILDLEKLAQLEKEGKIEAECGCDSPSFQIIHVLDKSIEPDLQKLAIVNCYQTEVDENQDDEINQVNASEDTISLQNEK